VHPSACTATAIVPRSHTGKPHGEHARPPLSQWPSGGSVWRRNRPGVHPTSWNGTCQHRSRQTSHKATYGPQAANPNSFRVARDPDGAHVPAHISEMVAALL